MATLERAGATDQLLLAQHLARYHFAKQFVSNRRVLDLGCGEGYGSSILKQSGAKVFSLDIAPEAVLAARQKGIENVVRADAKKMPFKNEKFDIITSFEVFEHITEVGLYIAQAHRLLRPGGNFLVSTPNVKFYPQAGLNPFHVKEYTYDEVKWLLESAGFRLKTAYAQITVGKAAEKLESSAILIGVMRLKRRLGFHGDLLPAGLQSLVKKSIVGGNLPEFNERDFEFIEGKIDSAELVYLAEA